MGMRHICIVTAAVLAVSVARAREPLVLTFTFDDATSDQMIAAAALEKYGWRGSFNVITAHVDRESAKPQAKEIGRPFTWAQCRDLVRRGHQVNSHSANHVNFQKLVKEGRMDEVRTEIAGSRDAIAKGTGKAPAFFCYPFVKGTKESDKAIVEAGMKPMTDLRIGFGGPCPQVPSAKPNDPDGPNSFAKIAEKWYEDGVVARDLMFHGIDPKVGIWRPFAHPDDFEKNLPALKELEKSGKIRVVGYDEFYAFAVAHRQAPKL